MSSRRVEPMRSGSQRRIADRRLVDAAIGALPGRARPGRWDGAILMQPIRAAAEGMQPRHLAIAIAAEELDKGAAIAHRRRRSTQAVAQASPDRIHLLCLDLLGRAAANGYQSIEFAQLEARVAKRYRVYEKCFDSDW